MSGAGEAGLSPDLRRALRIVRARGPAGTAAEDIRWEDFAPEVLERHPYLRGKRAEKLKEKRAPSVLLELAGAGLIARDGGTDAAPRYSPVTADSAPRRTS